MIVNGGIVLAKFSQHVDSFITIVYLCQIGLTTPTFITNYLTTEKNHSDLNGRQNTGQIFVVGKIDLYI